jgi:hypothetical protein
MSYINDCVTADGIPIKSKPEKCSSPSALSVLLLQELNLTFCKINSIYSYLVCSFPEYKVAYETVESDIKSADKKLFGDLQNQIIENER